MIRRKTDNRMTFTKRAVKALLFIGIINAEMSYVLSFMEKDPVDAVTIAWITEIVAVIVGYMCKSYFETKQERKQNNEDFVAESKTNEDDTVEEEPYG